MACGNCGDDTGWHVWKTREYATGKPIRVWVACADCNDDQQKPYPDVCEACGEKQGDCKCERSEEGR